MLVLKVLVCLILSKSALGSPYAGKFSILDIIKNNGYPVELYENLITEDGYLLDMQRIPRGKSDDGIDERLPILFVPPLLTSAEIYFTNPKDNLPFALADAGYDVWLSNTRGSLYSRKHLYLPINLNSSYWSYSWHEKGFYDLPVFIDFVRKMTGRKRIFLVGYSEGTTDASVLLSTRPTYNKKIELAIFLAPSIYIGHTSNNLLRYYANRIDSVREILFSLGIRGLYLDQEQLTNLRNPKWENRTRAFCENVLSIGINLDYYHVHYKMKPCDVVARILHGVSIKELTHYAQLIVSGEFKQYDYGIAGNRLVYGRETPPKYDLGKITAPIAIYYSLFDEFSPQEDMNLITRNLRSIVYLKEIRATNFTHLDFLLNDNIKTAMFDDVLNLLKLYS